MVLALGCTLCVVRAEETAGIRFSKADARDVRTELLHWTARAGADEAIAENIIIRWADDAELMQLTGEELLDELVESFAEIDAATRRLVESTWGRGPIEEVVYDGVRGDEFYRIHVELFKARWLTQHRYFDEALKILTQLSADETADPASLFFYRAVCQNELLKRDQALDSVSLLLDHTLDVPSRFRSVASMLQKELSGQDEEGMGHVSRLMADVRRQLDLGRSGERVQTREQEVVHAIDRLLEKLEKQNKQQQSSGQTGGSSPNLRPSGQAAPDSKIHGAAGKGDADRRDIKETGSWGMVDRQEEAKAREFIRQQFPASFLDIISEYSRRIAEQE